VWSPATCQLRSWSSHCILSLLTWPKHFTYTAEKSCTSFCKKSSYAWRCEARVSFQGVLSSPYELKSGVKQDCVVASTLFGIFSTVPQQAFHDDDKNDITDGGFPAYQHTGRLWLGHVWPRKENILCVELISISWNAERKIFQFRYFVNRGSLKVKTSSSEWETYISLKSSGVLKIDLSRSSQSDHLLVEVQPH